LHADASASVHRLPRRRQLDLAEHEVLMFMRATSIFASFSWMS
jgi:hypothetical protein